MLVPETDSEFKESDVKLDSLPHAKRENPFKYTELEVAENDIWLKQLMELYPHTPRYFHELAINYYRSVGTHHHEGRLLDLVPILAWVAVWYASRNRRIVNS